MYQFNVSGMTCMGCVNHIEKAIKALDRTSTIEIQLKDGIVKVTSNESLDKIKNVIEEEGYSVVSSKVF